MHLAKSVKTIDDEIILAANSRLMPYYVQIVQKKLFLSRKQPRQCLLNFTNVTTPQNASLFFNPNSPPAN
jgi:hypothetical protein